MSDYLMLSSFTCWVTCLLESYQDGIYAGLIKRGYTVGPPSISSGGDVKLNVPNVPSALLVFGVQATDPNLSVGQVHSDIRYILDDMKAYYFSLIVAGATQYVWGGTNIRFLSKREAPLLPPAKNKNSKLN